MAEPTEAPEETKAVPTTAPVDFIVPNQDLFERVIDARLEALKAADKPKARTRAAANKDADPKS